MSGSGGGGGKGTTFPCDVSDLCADQRSRVRGHDNSVLLSFRNSSAAAYLPARIRSTIHTVFCCCCCCHVNIKLVSVLCSLAPSA